MSADDEAPGGLPPPAANPDLLGHGWAEEVILNAWNSGRMPHAWLIAGPPGIGKATLAFRMARFVLAGGSPEAGQGDRLFEPDPTPRGLGVDPASRTARLVAAESHPDLRILRRRPM